MASTFQQLALRRKLIYIGLIVVLFSACMLFRGYVLETQGRALALRDQDVGETELSGRAVQLSLTGLRGLASCLLWNVAIELQRTNQWDELETTVRSITRLQPHFITPWLFQSWNLSYNVAVKCDLERDKYYYISRGIELLAEGERQNHDQPELRFAMGTYYQQKISQHDHKIPLQALFEMSAIDPLHRQSRWFWAYETDEQGRPKPKVDKYGWPVDLDLQGQEILRDKEGRPVDGKGQGIQLDSDHRPRFEVFCEQNPRLVRRLRDQLGMTTPKLAITWLDENLKIPTVYGERLAGEGGERHTRLKLNKEGPFPILPPPKPERDYDPMQEQSLGELEGDWDAYAAARVWFGYALEALPPPDPELPGQSQHPILDPIHQRDPVHMTTIIFRNFPSRAQSYVGERLEEDGWFDGSGWRLTGWFPRDQFSNGEPAVIGVGRDWAAGAFRRAHGMWEDHGRKNHLLLTPDQRAELEKQAKVYRVKYHLSEGMMPVALRQEDYENEEMRAGIKAHIILGMLNHALTLTNFNHFYVTSGVEMDSETVAVRKDLYEAERLRKLGRAQALPKYEDALKRWAVILNSNLEFAHDDTTQEDSFETEVNYTQLYQDTAEGRVLKQQLFAQAVLGGMLAPAPAEAWQSLAQAARPQAVSAPVLIGPLDGLAKDGKPLISSNAMDTVLRRPPHNLIHGQKGMPPGGMPGGMRGPGGMSRPPQGPPGPPVQPGARPG